MRRLRILCTTLAATGLMLVPGTVAAGPTDAAYVSVSISHTPEPATTSDTDVVFTVTVANGGPAAATDVALTTVLLYPNGSSVSGGPFRRYDALPSQGSCTTPTFREPSTPLGCQLGSLAADGSAQVTITIDTYRLRGAIVLQAGGRAIEVDADPTDNTDADVANVNGARV